MAFYFLDITSKGFESSLRNERFHSESERVDRDGERSNPLLPMSWGFFSLKMEER